MTTTIPGTKVDTPAALARARKTPSIGYPPVITAPETAVEDFAIVVSGKTYLIGPSIEGDPEEQATIDGTATITVAVRDPDGTLAALLADEGVILRDGVAMIVDGDLYMIQSVTVDQTTGTLVTIVFQDVVAWQLGLFTSFVAYPRAKYTRAEAALKVVDEASKHPLPPIKYYIPELTDAQRVAAAGTPVKKKTSPGTGAAVGYTVKGVPATAAQRANIDGALGECKAEGATARVMVAAIMAATQESSITTTATVTSKNGIQAGMYQQDSDWGPISGRRDPALSTSYFLNGWKKAFGSVKAAPGDIAADIETVQRSGLDPQSTYGQWKTEAEKTVVSWTGVNPGSSSASVDQPFEFTRGTKDSNGRVTSTESSWQATGEWAQTVNWRRWAQHNTLFFISDEELRQQAPGLQIDGNEPWLLARPAYTWNPDRSVQQATIRVLKKRWGLDIGASVLIPTAVGPASGIFLVTATDGYRRNPELTVTLNRPATKKPEPAQQTTSTASTASTLPTLATTGALSHAQTFDGHPVAVWIVPILKWARQHGWSGSVVSGYRTPAEQLAAARNYANQLGRPISSVYPDGPLASNHVKTVYPGGAVDVTQPEQLAQVLGSYPTPFKERLVWGGTTIEDAVHFSATGH